MNEIKPLSAIDHSREAVGLRYVYPVVSRRAGGVSIGVNLNVNNACNWQCIYCQVPGLTRGGPPPVDLAVLESELRSFIQELLTGDFMQTRVPEGARRIMDVAISGNGEPTSAAEFPDVVALIARILTDTGLAGAVVPRLITNGSLVGREAVQQGLASLGQAGGEIWFKVDAGTPERMERVNGIRIESATVAKRLARAAELCPTWIQTCMFAIDGQSPSEVDLGDYLDLLTTVRGHAMRAGAGAERPSLKKGLQGILLYGLARPSYQNDASRLSALSGDELERIAERIRQTGWPVKVSP